MAILQDILKACASYPVFAKEVPVTYISKVGKPTYLKTAEQLAFFLSNVELRLVTGSENTCKFKC